MKCNQRSPCPDPSSFCPCHDWDTSLEEEWGEILDCCVIVYIANWDGITVFLLDYWSCLLAVACLCAAGRLLRCALQCLCPPSRLLSAQARTTGQQRAEPPLLGGLLELPSPLRRSAAEPVASSERVLHGVRRLVRCQRLDTQLLIYTPLMLVYQSAFHTLQRFRGRIGEPDMRATRE